MFWPGNQRYNWDKVKVSSVPALFEKTPDDGHKFKALAFMVKMLITRAPDMEQWEQRRGHPMLTNPLLAPESNEWRASAEGQTLALLETSEVAR